MDVFKSALTIMLLVTFITTGEYSLAQDRDDSDNGSLPSKQEAMTNERLNTIITKIDPEFRGQPGFWQLRVNDIGIQIITDTNADRMRIIIPIRKADELDKDELYRVMQANYDSALDARYAIGQGILWSSFVHPLSSLTDRDFLSALGQTINTAISYGKTYSSGMFTFGGGDSGELIEKQLIEELLKKGQVI